MLTRVVQGTLAGVKKDVERKINREKLMIARRRTMIAKADDAED